MRRLAIKRSPTDVTYLTNKFFNGNLDICPILSTVKCKTSKGVAKDGTNHLNGRIVCQVGEQIT